MKRLRTISVAIIAVMLGPLIVCCENELKIFEGPYFVRFSRIALSEKESHLAPVLLEVHNGGPAPEKDVTISYSIGGSAREGIDYVILGTRGTVEIEEGEYLGYISVQLINNSNNILRQQDIVFRLETVNDEALHVGQGVSGIGKQLTFTIHDDCILGGDYYGIVNALSVPTENITITSTDCESYLLSNWDIEVFSFPSIRDLTFIDNGDNTLTIPPQEESTIISEFATMDGFGVVDPATRIVTMTVRLVDVEDQPEFTFKLIPN